MNIDNKKNEIFEHLYEIGIEIITIYGCQNFLEFRSHIMAYIIIKYAMNDLEKEIAISLMGELKTAMMFYFN